MEWIDVVGYTGTVLSSATFVPQVYQAWKTKSVGDLALGTIGILVLNVCTWLFWGLYKQMVLGQNQMPLIVANVIILTLALTLLFFKLTFKKK
jgi:MtN3 and saliva related transmembrane protein